MRKGFNLVLLSLVAALGVAVAPGARQRRRYSATR